MQSNPISTSLLVKKETNDFIESSFHSFSNGKLQEPIEVSSSSEDNTRRTEDTDDQCSGDASKQLILYDPTANTNREIEPFKSEARPISKCPGFNLPHRVLPSIGAFSVQCAECFKWRLIPTKEKYEEIREHITEKPFYCITAREWRPDISCDVPADIYQDDSRLWAIDKPNIAQPPPGWQRLLRIRGEGSSKFADVYYQTPYGKRLRSIVEVQKYLEAHPEFQEAGVSMSQFSFQVPKPLNQNYLRKRIASRRNSLPLENEEARPLCLTGPEDCTLQLGRSEFPPPASFHTPMPNPYDHSRKRRAIGSTTF